jgi:hypothetical protein
MFRFALPLVMAGFAALATPAVAATYTLTATTNQYGMGGFEMIFDDRNDDHVFTIDEVAGLTPFNIWHDWNITGITGLADLDFGKGSMLTGANPWYDFNFSFTDGLGRIATVGQNAYTYALTERTVDDVAPAVPVPAAGLLILGGLGALVALRVRRRAD